MKYVVEAMGLDCEFSLATPASGDERGASPGALKRSWINRSMLNKLQIVRMDVDFAQWRGLEWAGFDRV
jgi:hypothetical protein